MNKKHSSAEIRNLVHTPADLSCEYVAWAEERQKAPGVPFGLKSIDAHMIPMHPGDLVCLLARPGMGKTSLLAYLARAEAKRIVDRGAAESEVVVYTTWEQSAEELEAFFENDGEYSATDIAWGRVDLDAVRRRAIKRVQMPVWVIGHGIGRAGKKTPRMTPEVVLGAIETMYEDFGVRPVLLLFDYLQLIPVDRAADRVSQVTEAPILIKELALRIGAPAVCGVQAGRDVDTREDKIPEPRDAQWASSIEQTADKVFGLWRPWQTEEPDGHIKLAGKLYPVTEALFVLRMLKQRFDKGRYTWALHFAPQYLKLAELETRYLNQ